MTGLQADKLEQYLNVSRLARRLDRTREFVLVRIAHGSLIPDALDAGGNPLFWRDTLIRQRGSQRVAKRMEGQSQDADFKQFAFVFSVPARAMPG